MKLAFFQSTQIYANLTLLITSAVREVSNYGKSEIKENPRDCPKRACHWRDEETEVHAEEATWQKLHILIIGSKFP